MSSFNLDISNATPEQIAEIINYLKGNPSKVAPVERKVTYVAFVLDESGSMESCRDATIEGYNSALRDLQKAPADSGEFCLTLVKVNGFATTAFTRMPVKDVKPLTRQTYVPGGGTPLYDGIGTAISALSWDDSHLHGVNKAFLVSVFTDGMETGSVSWNGPKLSKKIVELQNKGTWTFTVTGANISLTDLSSHLGIPMNNMQTYNANPWGTQEAWSVQAQAQNSYAQLRSMGATNSSSFFSSDQSLSNAQAFPPKTAEQLKIEEDIKNAQLNQQTLISSSHSHS